MGILDRCECGEGSGEEVPDGVDGVEEGEVVEPFGGVEGVFVEDFEGGEDEEPFEGGGSVEGEGVAAVGFGDVTLWPVASAGDVEEPEFEDVGEEGEDVARGAGGESGEADQSPGEECDGDVAFPAGPAFAPEDDGEEEEDVDLIGVFVPLLVVGDAAQVDELSPEEVGEVGEDGDECADEGPAEDGE